MTESIDHVSDFIIAALNSKIARCLAGEIVMPCWSSVCEKQRGDVIIPQLAGNVQSSVSKVLGR